MYEPLEGKDFLLQNEVAYKKRVLLEGLSEAYNENPQFAEDIDIPLSYFLFEKLRKRAALYPPVVYSYSMTYSDEKGQENTSSSLVTFRSCAKVLEKEGLIDFEEDSDTVRIIPEHFKTGFGKKLSSSASYTARGIRQYAVHGYAGRVGLETMGREVLSKLERSKERSELPKVISEPKSLWSLKGTKLFPSSSDWLADLLDSFGMDKVSTSIIQKALGEIYNSTSFYTLTDESNQTKMAVAVKRYNDVKGMKWGVLNLWSLRNTNFTINAMERMHREFKALSEFKKIGLFTPEILAVFLSDKILVTRFIKGKDLSMIQSDYLKGETEDITAQYKFGATVAKIHSVNWCIGDSKPSNAILSESKEVYLTDLEQAHPNGNQVWDIAEFIYYSARLTLKEDRARKLVDSFIRGYIENGGDRKVIVETSALRYRAPFQAFIAPNVLNALRKDLASA